MQSETARRSEIPGETESDILTRHEALIRHLAYPFASSADELEDLMQDGRISLVLASRTWSPNGGAALWTYAYKSVYAAISRRKTRELEEPSSSRSLQAAADQLAAEGICSSERSAEALLELAELVSIASSELICLSEIERKAIRLRFVDELDVRSIAEALGIARSTAHDVLMAAISKLRERVGARS